VVREDPRERFTLRGTEGSVYVSFNDGDDWQPLQLNLPHTSMRDLNIHGDDLIVATHGRSFWILDDFTPLRQLNDEVANSARIFSRRKKQFVFAERNPDTPLLRIPAGKIRLMERSSTTTGERCERSGHAGIFDSQITSSAVFPARITNPMEKLAAENPIPMYWVRPEQILSAEPGMHRFVWNLHYARRMLSNTSFPFLRSIAIRRAIRWARGAARRLHREAFLGLLEFHKNVQRRNGPAHQDSSHRIAQAVRDGTGAVAE